MCTEYTQSLLALKEACMVNNIKLTCVFLGNESLVQRGRNTIAHHFMQMQDATHLIFIDADQKFVANDIARMIKADKGLVGGPVPMKGVFEVLRGDLADMQITLNTVSNNEHVPEMERHIRTTKERTRCVYNTLPFKRIPARMIIEMVYYSTFWLNSFPADDGISDTLSPRALVVGSQIDYASTVSSSLEHMCRLMRNMIIPWLPVLMVQSLCGQLAMNRVDIIS